MIRRHFVAIEFDNGFSTLIFFIVLPRLRNWRDGTVSLGPCGRALLSLFVSRRDLKFRAPLVL
jgi:hypothetical protein